MNDTIQDPLNVPSGEVPEQKFPVLVGDKLYAMEVAEVVRKGTKTEGVEMLRIKLVTLNEAQSLDGDVINPGFPVFVNWVFVPTGGLTATMINQQAKEIIEGCGLPATTTAAMLRDNPDIILNKKVCVKLKVRKASGEFDASNEVARGGWIKPSA